jgi:hypothetical protein
MTRVHTLLTMTVTALGALVGFPSHVEAQTTAPTTLSACAIPLIGSMYLIKQPGLPTKCFGPVDGPYKHTLVSWNDGAGALRNGTSAGGDLAGSYPNPSVARLQGKDIDPTGPAEGAVLTFKNGKWTPVSPVATSGGITGWESVYWSFVLTLTSPAQTQFVECPAGKKPLSAGNDVVAGVQVVESFPLPATPTSRDGWHFSVKWETAGSPLGSVFYNVFVICANAS